MHGDECWHWDSVVFVPDESHRCSLENSEAIECRFIKNWQKTTVFSTKRYNTLKSRLLLVVPILTNVVCKILFITVENAPLIVDSTYIKGVFQLEICSIV